jgi:hypothetical protein
MIAKTSAFAVHPSDFPPDSFELKGEKNGLIKRPNENFVLCKDKKGLPTAIYGDAIWNFKSYQTTKKGYSTFKFPESMHCIDEIKWLLFLNIYCADNSHLGKIGIETLSHRFHFYRSVANYCYKNGITVFEFFTDEKSIVQYVKKNQNSYQRLKQLKIAIRFHMVLTENIAGFRQL